MSIIEISSSETYCRYNKMVDCREKRCSRCGWNPDVKAVRLKDFYNARRNATVQKQCELEA